MLFDQGRRPRTRSGAARGISSLEALTYFHDHHRRVPVIVITGSIQQEVARHARAGGAFEVVGKPFDIDALQGLLARAMQLAPRP
jgi:DNA-binding NtrC family response regulator